MHYDAGIKSSIDKINDPCLRIVKNDQRGIRRAESRLAKPSSCAAADCAPITRLLDLHEQQLQTAPVFAVDEAESRVVHFGRSDKRSPW
jgi:hypothetical protein